MTTKRDGETNDSGPIKRQEPQLPKDLSPYDVTRPDAAPQIKPERALPQDDLRKIDSTGVGE